MRIESSNVVLASSHQLRQSISRNESLESWTGQRPSAAGETNSPVPSQTGQNASLTGKILTGDSMAIHSPQGAKEARDSSDSNEGLDAPTLLIKLLIEKMFGGRMHLGLHPGRGRSDLVRQEPVTTSQAAPVSQGWGVEYKSDEVIRETEQLQFAAAGVIKTADGQEISFGLRVDVQRVNVQERHIDVTGGEKPVDPLVLNFDGPAAELNSGTFQFDLLSDGQAETLPLLGSASAFLALDRNGDGRINNGSELFGPSSGNGFSELAQLDSDKNGWIDENDSAYAALRLWQPNASGEGILSALAEKKVGAIYLDSVTTPFTYKDAAGRTQATTSATSIFLQESGTAGTIQQLNYTA